MRGGGRIGGKTFKVPRDTGGGKSYDPFEMSDLIGDLPVAPTLEPINDNFSWSVGADAADPRDCSRYPSSPYCGEIPLRIGSPFGYEPEIRTNGCETCLYVYPVIMWLKVTPQVICYRDPNCDRDPPPFNPREKDKPREYDENVQPDKYKSPQCAERESVINIYHNWVNSFPIPTGWKNTHGDEVRVTGTSNSPKLTYLEPYGQSFYGEFRIGDGSRGARKAGGDTFISWEIIIYYDVYLNNILVNQTTSGLLRMEWIPALCPNMPSPPIIKPPPPVDDGSDEDKKRKKRGGKDMCCSECKDAADNTSKLLKEIKEIKKALGTGQFEKAVNAAIGIGDGSVTAIVNLVAKRLGTSSYPIEVPESLLTGTGTGKVIKAESNAEYLFWLTQQLDSLVGEFPIDIEIKDIDPLKDGDQTKVIKLPNIAEAIAEIYGLTMKSCVNQEVELNMLLRLAAETIATKNAAIVTQDYARANATFLGYKGNYKPRELQYNFDFATTNLNSGSPVVLEKLLKTVKGYVQGWQIEDKETVVGFLQKLMFSAGIIKAVFFRGKNQQKELNRELTSMNNDEKAQEKKFEAFIKEMNDPESRFNKDSQDKPIIRDITPPSTGAQ